MFIVMIGILGVIFSILSIIDLIVEKLYERYGKIDKKRIK